mmetsp:Transcript_9298/g.26133  ORF Transcript_9298/g.26133 Transcript_9298/m.26133 type:complete len:364 (+) Transcript_9298:1754-2845(+)
MREDVHGMSGREQHSHHACGDVLPSRERLRHRDARRLASRQLTRQGLHDLDRTDDRGTACAHEVPRAQAGAPAQLRLQHLEALRHNPLSKATRSLLAEGRKHPWARREHCARPLPGSLELVGAALKELCYHVGHTGADDGEAVTSGNHVLAPLNAPAHEASMVALGHPEVVLHTLLERRVLARQDQVPQQDAQETTEVVAAHLPKILAFRQHAELALQRDIEHDDVALPTHGLKPPTQLDYATQDHRVVLVMEDVKGHALGLVVRVLALTRFAQGEEVRASMHMLQKAQVPLHIVVELGQMHRVHIEAPGARLCVVDKATTTHLPHLLAGDASALPHNAEEVVGVTGGEKGEVALTDGNVVGG